MLLIISLYFYMDYFTEMCSNLARVVTAFEFMIFSLYPHELLNHICKQPSVKISWLVDLFLTPR